MVLAAWFRERRTQGSTTLTEEAPKFERVGGVALLWQLAT
jgi:hypothetical protein